MRVRWRASWPVLLWTIAAASPRRAGASADRDLLQAICELTTSRIFSDFENLSRWLLILGIPAAVIALGVAGNFLITAQGEPSRISKGKSMLHWALAGLLLLLLARGIVVGTGRLIGADIPLAAAPPETSPPRNCR